MAEISPNFELKDHRGELHRSEDFRGKKVLLSFHPLAWTKLCADQMLSLEHNHGALSDRGAVAVGVSVDPVPSKGAWADSLEIRKTPLLSDFWPHGKLAEDLGIFREEDGFSERANIILGENGEVVFEKVYPISELPDMDEILEFLSG